MKESTTSCPQHNKNLEHVFGLLDFLCRNRPNAFTLSNEAMLMYVYNHTNEYLRAKTETELNQLLSAVKLCTPDIVKQYKARGKAIL